MFSPGNTPGHELKAWHVRSIGSFREQKVRDQTQQSDPKDKGEISRVPKGPLNSMKSGSQKDVPPKHVHKLEGHAQQAFIVDLCTFNSWPLILL